MNPLLVEYPVAQNKKKRDWICSVARGLAKMVSKKKTSRFQRKHHHKIVWTYISLSVEGEPLYRRSAMEKGKK